MDELDQIRAARLLIEKHLKILESKQNKKIIQGEIAEATGLSQSVIGVYLRGFVMGAKFEQLIKFLSWLEIDPNELAQVTGLIKTPSNKR